MITTRCRRGIAAAAVGASTAVAGIVLAIAPAGAVAQPAPCQPGSLTNCEIPPHGTLGNLLGVNLNPSTCPDPSSLVSLQVLAGTDSTALANARIRAHNAMVANKAAEVALNQAQAADTAEDTTSPTVVDNPAAPDAQDIALAKAQTAALTAATAANAADAKVDQLQRAVNRDNSAVAVITARIGACTTVTPTPTPAPATTIVQPGPTTVVQPAPVPAIETNSLPVTG